MSSNSWRNLPLNWTSGDYKSGQIAPTKKNTTTLLALEFSHERVRQTLKELTVEDYSEGPIPDKLYSNTPMWIFGKTIKGREVYIKIQIGHPNSQTICISFHFSEYKMIYPFKIVCI